MKPTTVKNTGALWPCCSIFQLNVLATASFVTRGLTCFASSKETKSFGLAFKVLAQLP